MQKKAIDKARMKLQWAHEHYDDLQKCRNFSEFLKTWMQFLVALDGIPICLNVCRHDNSKTRQWCGEKSVQARKDELLAYLHHARNEEYHGLEPIAQDVPGGIGIGAAGETVFIKNMTIENGRLVTFESVPINGKHPTIVFKSPHAKLMDVFDTRDSRTYRVPQSHLGTKIENQSPANLAKMGLEYYAGYISEAEKLLPQSA